MSNEEKNKTIVRRLIDEAFNKRNLTILPELLHKEFVNHHDLVDVDNKKSPAVFEELYTKLFESFPDIIIDNHMMIAKNDMIILYDKLRGTNTGPLSNSQPATGKSVEFEAVNILRIKDDKVIERWGLTDELKMMKQLGLIDLTN